MIISEIEILGIIIREPGTFISDLLMGIVCLFFYFKLKQKAQNKQQKFLSFFFLFLAISSSIAALAHGLVLYFGKTLHVLGWSFGASAVYYILTGSSDMIKNQSLKVFYKWFNLIQLILLIFFLLISPDFTLVKISFAFSLLGILLPLYIIDSIKNYSIAHFYIFFGIAIACIPALFHTAQFEFGYIFNMNDLSHFMLMICFYFIYIGLQKRFFDVSKDSQVAEDKEFVEISAN